MPAWTRALGRGLFSPRGLTLGGILGLGGGAYALQRGREAQRPFAVDVPDDFLKRLWRDRNKNRDPTSMQPPSPSRGGYDIYGTGNQVLVPAGEPPGQHSDMGLRQHLLPPFNPSEIERRSESIAPLYQRLLQWPQGDLKELVHERAYGSPGFWRQAVGGQLGMAWEKWLDQHPEVSPARYYEAMRQEARRIPYSSTVQSQTPEWFGGPAVIRANNAWQRRMFLPPLSSEYRTGPRGALPSVFVHESTHVYQKPVPEAILPWPGSLAMVEHARTANRLAHEYPAVLNEVLHLNNAYQRATGQPPPGRLLGPLKGYNPDAGWAVRMAQKHNVVPGTADFQKLYNQHQNVRDWTDMVLRTLHEGERLRAE